MNEGLIVSVSGVRGIVGEQLDAVAALRFTQSLAATLPRGPVIVSGDSRPSGRWLRRLASAVLESAGREVLLLGIIPTPTVGVAVRHLKAAGALHITASHNPAPYNGLKMFGPDGRVLPSGPAGKIRDAFLGTDSFPAVPWDQCGQEKHLNDAMRWHADLVLKAATADGLVEPIRKAGFRVLVDGNGGAGGQLALLLLKELGVETIPWNCEPNGLFAHPPEPTGENLRDLEPVVRDAGVDLAFVLDPDADRLALLDATGRFPGEEYTLALAADGLLARRPGPLVINLSTSRLSEMAAKARGCACYRSPVGEANVVDEMLLRRAVLGGEGNGGVMDPRVGWVRDPYVGMALVLGSLAISGRSLAQAIDALPRMFIFKEKVPLIREHLPTWCAALKSRWSDWGVDERDGLRLESETGWIQVRASNTEPIARIIAEGLEPGEVEGWIRQATALVPV